jgi:hypothetical protein
MSLGSTGSIAGALLTSVGTEADDSCLGTTTIGMGSTVSSALNSNNADEVKVAQINHAYMYVESMSQEELKNTLAIIESMEEQFGVSEEITEVVKVKQI